MPFRRRKPQPAFVSEEAMTSRAIDRRSSFWGSGLPCEFAAVEAVGLGAVADVVLVSFDRRAATSRDVHGIRPITDWTTLGCVLACRGRSLGYSELAPILGVSESTVRRACGLALASGAVVRHDGFRTHPDWRPVARRLVALELKLRDWARGLGQAWCYSRWADASWLVLGASAPDTAVAAAAEAGVGLGRLGADGSVNVLGKPARQRRFDERQRIWIGEQILAQYEAVGSATTEPGATSLVASAAAAA